MTRLIVDSTCDMNDEIKNRYDFDIIPLSIILDDQAYLDGVEIDTAKVYAYMKNGGIPKTSQISYASLISVLDKCVENKEDFIYLTFSSKMSGTYNLAYGVIQEYKEKYPEINMEIIDSEGGSGGASLIAIQTLRMMEKNIPFENLVKNINFMKEHIHYHFTLPNIEWLAKGGRVNKGVGYIGDKLDIKPYLTVIDGKIELQKVMIGRKKSLKTLVDDTLAYVRDFKNQLIIISHADDFAAANSVEEKLKKALPDSEVLIISIGSVLGVHIGLGGIGVFALDHRFEGYQFE
ncbi:MAG: DegV family protein [Clostridiaceae bacterium]